MEAGSAADIAALSDGVNPALSFKRIAGLGGSSPPKAGKPKGGDPKKRSAY
jgi:hypothetical protein